MKYRIGDVSRLLKLSDQMIRYYEKCGVISPQRSGDGNYRYYTDMDIFRLFDAMRYKEMNINIADVNHLISADYYEQLSEKLLQFKEHLSQEIQYKSLLQQRIDFIQKNLLTCRYNVENYWVEMIPEHYMYYMGTSHKDSYDISELHDHMAEQIYSSRCISFFDVCVKYDNDCCSWWYRIQKKYHDHLNIEDDGRYVFVPELLCLNTMIDMGEPGEFSEDCFLPLLAYANQRGFTVSGPIDGIIIGRGMSNERFCRMMRIMVPIKTL